MELVPYFKALADTTRLRIFNILTNHELNVNEIMEVMEMGQSRISRHLKILTESKLLNLRQDGLWSFYTARKDSLTHQFISLLKQNASTNTELDTDQLRAQQVLKERQNKSKRFFNRIASDWDRLKKDILGDANLTKLITDRSPLCDAAADLGCGTGELLFALKEKAKRVIGVDNSPKMLALATTRLKDTPDGFELRLGEMEHLPIRDEEVDHAVVNMVLHHMPSPALGIQEVYRVLKPSGTFIIVDFDKHQNESLRHTYGDRWLGIKKKEMEKWLTQTGFTIIESGQIKVQKKLKIHISVSKKSMKEKT